MSDNLTPLIELETGILPTHTILWMHGLGADGNDLIPIVRQINFPSNIHIRLLFPHAPMRPITINHGSVLRAWYDIYNLDFDCREDIVGLRSSQLTIEGIIDLEEQRGIPPENILLAGFSQGGVMALYAGLRYAKKLAGIVALSCYLPLAKNLSIEAHKANLDIPIFMAHGHNDSMIALTLATASKKELLDSGYDLEWHEYPMEHSVCIREIVDISNWLKRVLI